MPTSPLLKRDYDRIIRNKPRLFEQLLKVAQAGGRVVGLTNTMGSKFTGPLVLMGLLERKRETGHLVIFEVTDKGWAVLRIGCPCCGHQPWVKKKGADDAS